MGSVLALTGNGSFYGKTMSRGIDLAVKHIKAAGGPDIKVVYKDHKSGDPQAGVQAMTELGTSGIPAKLASYGDDILAMLPLTQQYKCLTLDGGGGERGRRPESGLLLGRPCPARPRRAARAVPIHAGGLSRREDDRVHRLGPRCPEQRRRPAAVQGGAEDQHAAVQRPATSWLRRTPPTSPTCRRKIKANEPDILIVGSFGQDPGFFIDQAQTANLEAKIFGYEFTPDGLNASKGAFDSVGWNFSSDYFDVGAAKSKLAKLFISEFKAAYGEEPDFYAANYYEDTLGMWDLVRRVLAKGGDINSGVDLQNALKDKPELVSVYGGDETTVGTFAMDPTTHSVVRRQMGVFERQGRQGRDARAVQHRRRRLPEARRPELKPPAG